jgi:hypothetical protein
LGRSEHSERKLATVLFADLAGSTALADEQDARALHAALSMQRRLESMFGSDLALRIDVNTEKPWSAEPAQTARKTLRRFRKLAAG